MKPLITLTTDFGSKEFYQAQLKASIYRHNSEAIILDVSHDVEPHDITQAAFFVKNILKETPENSIHIIAVNNFYGKKVEFVCTKWKNQYFVAPNNGVLSLIVNNGDGESTYYTIDTKKIENPSLEGIFSHAVAFLSHGLPFNEIGPLCENLVAKLELKPVITSSQIRATIIHVDRYENVIVNLKREEFEKWRDGRTFSIYYKQNDPITNISEHFGQVPIGEVLCYFNTNDYLTIAINMGKASSFLNLFRNETIQINFF